MSIFDSAPVTATVKVSRSKADKREVHAVNGLSELAAINAMIGTLEGLAPQFEAQVKDESLAILVAEALKTGKKPETFNLVDDMSTGQYQMRKRSTASALTDDEINVCKAYGIPTTTNTKVEARYVFNPDCLADQKVMEKISKALLKIPELAGMAIIQRQEAVETTVIAEGAIEVACKLKAKDSMVAALGVAGVQALKTSFDSDQVKDALEVLAKAGIKLVPDAAPKKEKKAKKEKASV